MIILAAYLHTSMMEKQPMWLMSTSSWEKQGNIQAGASYGVWQIWMACCSRCLFTWQQLTGFWGKTRYFNTFLSLKKTLKGLKIRSCDKAEKIIYALPNHTIIMCLIFLSIFQGGKCLVWVSTTTWKLSLSFKHDRQESLTRYPTRVSASNPSVWPVNLFPCQESKADIVMLFKLCLEAQKTLICCVFLLYWTFMNASLILNLF